MTPQEKWGLEKLPFRRNVEGHEFYETAAHREALARMEWVLEQNALGLLTGEVGSGKSTLIRRLIGGLDEMKWLPIYICVPGLRPREFYGELLSYLGEASPYSVNRARKLWNERVQAGGLAGERRWVVVIDEAQDISEEMLQELRFVRNQRMDAVSPFPLILVGQPELRRKLRLKKYEAISQRIEMVYHLTGMTREETADYVRHQIQLTGKAAPLFTDSALHLIYGASRGIPRVVNQICLQALYDAAAKNSDVVEDAHIQRVLADQEWQRGAAG
ncbi:ATPase AAA [Alicyclobacillus cellulosilyticus]|uniref:ATPase AAA n=1 Tax=Alicyclobacillus cellulosilyticus TaxID=1003997 RepID=A0A917KJM8_9BACL|nr:AAA family ATPase [Alicyclobacillus cellulosilyticus]GGJ14538.1 ATPase AAA [Alicyclobacillus cellulosilyticus]